MLPPAQKVAINHITILATQIPKAGCSQQRMGHCAYLFFFSN